MASYDEQKKLLLDDLKLRMNQHREYENAIREEQRYRINVYVITLYRNRSSVPGNFVPININYRKYTELEQELLKFKAKYVKLLGSSIKISEL